MYAALNSLSLMLTGMMLGMCVLSTYQNMCLTLGVQLLHFPEGLAALFKYISVVVCVCVCVAFKDRSCKINYNYYCFCTYVIVFVSFCVFVVSCSICFSDFVWLYLFLCSYVCFCVVVSVSV